MKTKITITALLLLLLASFAGCSKIEIDERNKFTGRYAVEEYNYVDGSLSYYDVRIRKVSGSDDEIVFENFFNAGINVFGVVVGTRVYIEAQTSGIFWVEGQGTISGNVLNMSYFVVVTIGQSTYDHDINATLTKY
ncbi:MAG: hypothetical protein K0B09_07505 [Bacteroidales bacterium]|nr:hypothetical protein [Bacteroidales bacterium]